MKKTPELVRRGLVIPVIDYLLAFIIDQHLFSSLEITPFLPLSGDIRWPHFFGLRSRSLQYAALR